MKKIYTLLLSVSLFATSHAQTNCNAGYENPVYTGTTSIPNSVVVLIDAVAANAGTLTDISINTTGL